MVRLAPVGLIVTMDRRLEAIATAKKELRKLIQCLEWMSISLRALLGSIVREARSCI